MITSTEASIISAFVDDGVMFIGVVCVLSVADHSTDGSDPVGLGGPVFATASVPDEHKVGHVGPWVNPLLQTLTFGGSDTDSHIKYTFPM
jgi:hypothetical protein